MRMSIPNTPGVYQLGSIRVTVYRNEIVLEDCNEPQKQSMTVTKQEVQPTQPYDWLNNPPPLGDSIPRAIEKIRKMREKL